MSGNRSTAPEPSVSRTADRSDSAESRVAADPRRKERKENWRWWIKVCVQPVIFLACIVALLFALGLAQRFGYFSSSGAGGHEVAEASSDTLYVCPMMCTPPQTEPGRCPVCGMELVPTSANQGGGDPQSVQIGQAARRVANIETTPVVSMSVLRSIQAIGELSYDEGTLKTISAYVDGRLEQLYADYTGVVVKKGDQLALVYSPLLYSAQVEFLLAKKAFAQSQSSPLDRTSQSSHEMYRSAQRRLIELGMTQEQIDHLESSGEATSRLNLVAPISGTVIEKHAVEGEYLKEGQPIYRLADLTTVWLMLELFPDDAANIRYGQKVEAEVQSLPGQKFSGRVAFVDPNVDPITRTVGVRVVMENRDGKLRIGDYAQATIRVPLDHQADQTVFDAELADKWISPRHPHIVADAPGTCPLCGIDLVPAQQFGYSSEPDDVSKSLVVPRRAVLMAGKNSVVYVETEPGRFEIRRVVLGPELGDQIVIREGVSEGEEVATRGNFLIDSQMQLVGNPSLIDPNKASPTSDAASSPEVLAGLKDLSEEDRLLATQQRICPVSDQPLGTMGTPIKVEVNEAPVFICCEACRRRLLENPGRYLERLAQRAEAAASEEMLMDLPPIAAPIVVSESDEAEVDESEGVFPSADFPIEVVE